MRLETPVRLHAAFFLLILIAATSVPARGQPAPHEFPGYTLTAWDARSGLPASTVWAINQDADGYVWLGTDNGLIRFDGVRFVPWAALGRPALPVEQVLALYRSRDASLWVGFGGTGGVARIRADGVTLYRAGTIGSGRVTTFGEDDGGVWASVLGETFRLVEDHWEASEPASLTGRLSALSDARRHLPADAPLSRAVRNRAGGIWAGTLGDGLWHVHPDAHDGPEVGTRVDHGLADESIRDLYGDVEGNIWVGSQSGLRRLSPSRVEGHAARGSVRAVAAGNGKSVWAGTSVGLQRFDDAGVGGDLPATESVSALHRDRRGALWLATPRGLDRLAGGRLERVTGPADRRRWLVSGISSVDGGDLWVSDLATGLYRWDGDRLHAVALPIDPPVYSVHASPGGDVWVGFTAGRLGRLRRDGAFESFEVPDVSAIWSIHEDDGGVLWLAGTGGLTRYRDGVFTTVNESHGLPGNVVSGMVEDEEGFLWAGLGLGIVRLHPDEVEEVATDPAHQVDLRVYDASDGLAGPPIWLGSPSATRGADGRLWFVTGGGLTALDPGALGEPPPPPRVLIEGASVDDRAWEAQDGSEVPPAPSRVVIDYTSPSHAAATKMRFRYRLEGFDEGWVDAGGRRQAVYTNLGPGDYTFRVVANDGHRDWSGIGPSWSFSIRPHLHETPWFLAMLALLVLAAAAFAWRVNARMARRRFALVLGERTRLSREIHDTLLQSLVGLSLQIETLAKGPNPPAAPLRDQLVHLRKQVEEHIREARQAVSDLRSPMLQRTNLVEALRAVGEEAARGTATGFSLRVDGRPRPCPPEIEGQALRIVQEAVANVMQHAGARHLVVGVGYRGAGLRLEVTDDGRGLTRPNGSGLTRPDGPGGDLAGWGLTGMRERAESAGGTLAVTSEPGRGTTVAVWLPAPAHRASRRR